MSWFVLIVAGLFETAFAYCLGRMRGLSGAEYYGWGAAFLVCLLLSMLLLSRATQVIPIGTAYPVWTVIGAVGTVLLGMVCFHEPASALRLFLSGC